MTRYLFKINNKGIESKKYTVTFAMNAHKKIIRTVETDFRDHS